MNPEPKPRRPVRSIRLIVSLSTILLVTISVLGVGMLAERNTSRSLNQEIQVRLQLEAAGLANMAADLLLDDYPEMVLCPMVSDMLSDRPELACVAVLDHQRHIVGYADARQLGQVLPLYGTLQPEAGMTTGEGSIRWLGNPEMLVVIVDAMAGGQKVGEAIVGLHRSYIGDMLARARLQIVVFSAIMLLLGVAGSAFLMNRLLKPIEPLKLGMERIGRGDLDTPIALNNRTELGLLADTVDDMARQIKASQRDLVVKERLAHEMDLAFRIQSSLMPDTHVQSGGFFIEGSYKAAMEVGGDYFDIFELPDGRVGLMIADVAGKGLGGCLVTSMLAVLLKSLRNRHTSPSELLVALELGLEGFLRPGVFVTAFYGILDPQTNELVYASAAHSPLTVYRAAEGKVETFRTRGIPIGAVKGGMLAKTLEDARLVLGPRDVMLQYTDGLNEAPSSEDNEEFGFDRIDEIMRRAAPQGRKNLLRSLREGVVKWAGEQSHHDDLTMLVVSHEGSLSSSGSPGDRSIVEVIGSLADEDALSDVLIDTDHMQFPTRMAVLDEISGWLQSTLKRHEVADEISALLDNAVYELCANIAEHGFTADQPGAIDIWFRSPRSSLASAAVEADPDSLGCLVVRDRGTPFDPGSWKMPDLSDVQVRRRGRGLGLMMIDKILDEIVYLPGTGLGNFSLIRIGPLNEMDTEDKHA